MPTSSVDCLHFCELVTLISSGDIFFVIETSFWKFFYCYMIIIAIKSLLPDLWHMNLIWGWSHHSWYFLVWVREESKEIFDQDSSTSWMLWRIFLWEYLSGIAHFLDVQEPLNLYAIYSKLKIKIITLLSPPASFSSVGNTWILCLSSSSSSFATAFNLSAEESMSGWSSLSSAPLA